MRKLGRTASQRKALLRGQVTALIWHGKIVTTEMRAREVKAIAEKLIALAVAEQDNFEKVEVTAHVARKDKDGKNIREERDGKRVKVYDEVKRQVKKDHPSRLSVRRQMLKVLYPVTEVPEGTAGVKRGTKRIDLANKLFDEIAPKYRDRKGGYTRIIKLGQRRGDAAMQVVLELV